jgi:hypothetical protein
MASFSDIHRCDMFFVLLCILLPSFAVWFFWGSLDVYKTRRFWCNVSLVCAEGKGGSGGMVEWRSGRWWEVVVVVVMVMLARWCLMRLDRSMSLLESRPNYPEGARYQLHILAKLGSLPEIRLQHSRPIEHRRPIQHPCPLHHRVNFILKNCLRQYHFASSGRGAE